MGRLLILLNSSMRTFNLKLKCVDAGMPMFAVIDELRESIRDEQSVVASYSGLWRWFRQ